jgi:hypothetical protein
MCPQVAKQRLDRRIADIAGRQHGVVAVGQLHAASADPSAIKRRVAAGLSTAFIAVVTPSGIPDLAMKGNGWRRCLPAGNAPP